MDRKDFTKSLLAMGLCPFLAAAAEAKSATDTEPEKSCEQTTQEKLFIEHWLTDLMSTMDDVLDRETRVKLIEGCGRGCYNRHSFKQDIARNGAGDVDTLVKAYSKNFQIWRDGNEVHIRYGEVNGQCYCPVAQGQPVKPDDLHCECTRSTHQTIFETALGRPIQVDVVESLRRGGVTCHFIAHV